MHPMPVCLTKRRAQVWPVLPALVGVALVAVLAAGVTHEPHAQGAAPCHVPDGYATIQAAVDDATCATINIAAGTYNVGGIRSGLLIARSVILRGDGQGPTLLDGGGSSCVPASVLSIPGPANAGYVEGGASPEGAGGRTLH